MKPLSTIAAIAAHALTPDTAFMLDEGTGTTVYRWGDATCTGSFQGATGPFWRRSPEVGKYVYLGSSTGRIRVADHAAIRPTRPGGWVETWTFFIQFAIPIAVTIPSGRLISKAGDWMVQYTNSTGEIAFYWHNGTNTSFAKAASSFVFYQGPYRFTLAGVVSSNAPAALYLNGRPLSITTGTDTTLGSFVGTNPMSLGAADDGTSKMPMTVEYLALYRSALTAAQVKSLAFNPWVWRDVTGQGTWVPWLTRSSFPTGENTNISSNGGSATVRHAGRALFTGADPKVAYVGAYGSTNGGSTWTVASAALENSGYGTVSFSGGATSATVTPGTIVLSSAVSLSAGPLISVAGSVVATNTRILAAGATPYSQYTGYGHQSGYPLHGWAEDQGDNGAAAAGYLAPLLNTPLTTTTANHDGHDYGSDKVTSGTVTSSNILISSPTTLLARRTTNLRTPVLCLIGDSIMAGQGNGSLGNSGIGWLADACSARRIPYYVIALPGEAASADLTLRLQAAVQFGCTHAVVAYGRNDLDSAVVADTILTRLTTLAATCYTAFGTRPAVATVSPNTTSTDSWATVANQTVANATHERDRQRLNHAIANQYETLGYSACIPIHHVVGDVTWQTKWYPALASDAKHPNTNGHLFMARAALAYLDHLNALTITTSTSSSAASAGGTVTLTGSGYGGQGWYDYAWTIVTQPGGANATFSSSTSATPVVTFDTVGLHTFRCTVTDGMGATATSDVSVRVLVSATAVVLNVDRGDATLGTNVQATAPQVIQGITIGAGAYQISGSYVRPTASQLVSGATVGAGAYQVAGTYVTVSASNVRSGVSVGVGGTGTLVVSSTTLQRDTVEIVRGDSYLFADGNHKTLTKVAGQFWPPSLAGWTITFTARRNADKATITSGDSASFTSTGTVVRAADSGDDLQEIRYDLTAAVTALASTGTAAYDWDVQASNGSSRVTLAMGIVNVLPQQTTT